MEGGEPSDAVPVIRAETSLSVATTRVDSFQLPSGSQEMVRRPSDSASGQLGLNVVYCPDNGHKANIVFVHGLGGTSRKTWSKDANPALFWPLTFLPLEADLCLARILTFGYDADFRKAGNLNTSVLDFAKDLLFDLKHARDGQGQALEMERVGQGLHFSTWKKVNRLQVPLIFVVHSMGGLITKEVWTPRGPTS